METVLITPGQASLGRALIGDEHGRRCARMAVVLAKRLDIHDPHVLDVLEEGARIHDFGKAWVPDWIVLKHGKLDPQEYERIKLHPVAATEFLDHIAIDGHLREIVRHHHERWDGTGYPDNLVGQDIPMMARIVAVVDTYDALMGERSYPRYDERGRPLKHAGSFRHDEAIEIIKGSAGLAFDPKVAKAFVKMKEQEWR